MTSSKRQGGSAGEAYVDPGSPYRLGAQSQARIGEGQSLGQSFTSDIADQHRNEDTPRLLRLWRYAGWESGFTVLAVAVFLASALLVASGSSWASRGQLALLALLPLTVIVAVLAWIDRWAPLDRKYKIVAVAWGGGVAAVLAAVVNSAVFSDLLLYRGDVDQATAITAVVAAPIAEEVFKGLGAIIVLVWARNQLSSTLSAVALAALVGAGFAYVENLEYFWQASLEGSTAFGLTVFARSVLSPFVHPMATSFVGLAAGSALLRRVRVGGWIWRLSLGLLVAMAIHALWNGLSLVGATWFLWYLFLEIPLFLAWITGMIVWSERLARTVDNGLQPYVNTGWITPVEVLVVTLPAARRRARKWARSLGKPAPSLLRKFQRALGRLGMDQALVSEFGVQPGRAQKSRHDLDQALQLRSDLLDLEIVHSGAGKVT